MKHVAPTIDSSRLVSTIENGQFSFPGIRVRATVANIGLETNMTPTVTINRLNMKQYLTKDPSAIVEIEGTPVMQDCLEAVTCFAKMY